MFDIDNFLSEFENVIFDEHLEKLKSFKHLHGNAVSCSCSHILKEKEKIAKIMETYRKLSKRFSGWLPYSSQRYAGSVGSYDTVDLFNTI